MPQQFSTASEVFLRDLRLQSFNAVQQELEKLRQSPQILLSPGWNLAHTFDHCARSIEHSMLGFPILNNPLFRTVIGPVAFQVFDLRGYMSHNLTEEIPGDAEPTETLSFEAALERLQKSIRDFDQWQGDMKPHFAYGSLTKGQYERANAMHVANHLASMEY
ncbi:MAG: DUF1569 domain-containing protein [Bacteroidota bacterium]